MDKSPKMNALLNKFALAEFGRSRTECIMRNICVTCGGPAHVFRDEACRREYHISVMCQVCQDQVFPPQ